MQIRSKSVKSFIKPKRFLSFEDKKVLVNSYFFSTFNYCPLTWMLSSAKFLNKIGSLQKRAIYLYSDYESHDPLLAKSSKVTMKASSLRSPYVEFYKSINSINPSFTNKIFRFRVTNKAFCSHYRLNLDIPEVSQVSFGNKSIRSLRPKTWNSLRPHIKSRENLETFKRVIKNWDGITSN